MSQGVHKSEQICGDGAAIQAHFTEKPKDEPKEDFGCLAAQLGKEFDGALCGPQQTLCAIPSLEGKSFERCRSLPLYKYHSRSRSTRCNGGE